MCVWGGGEAKDKRDVQDKERTTGYEERGGREPSQGRRAATRRKIYDAFKHCWETVPLKVISDVSGAASVPVTSLLLLLLLLLEKPSSSC